ncbi:transporter substrate-binding domain-containing protein [Sphaerisporangium album]|uniref:transporter substrate-binding domain-containing protein n=1 Tax=Sphaerisporangium album TaxID=509200 RepID=UPI0015F07F1E|nr:transporter substrate-binding domain-containing protein [Sphaerisporangium album]
MTTDHPGWSTHEAGTNRRTGFDIALADWLRSRLARDVTFVDLRLEERIEALEDHKVHMVISTFSITDERRKVIDFAGPYMITRQGVLVRKDDHRIKNYDDLTRKNRNICVASGTTSQEQLQPFNGKGLALTVEPALQGCFERLVNKQVDAFSTDQLVLHGFAKSRLETRVLDDLTFGAQEQYGIGLPNHDKSTCDLLAGHLKTFLYEGKWEEFLERNLHPANLAAYKPLDLDPCEDGTT